MREFANKQAGGCLPWQTVTMRRRIFEETMLSCVWRVSVGKCHWVISLLTFPSWRQELHHLLDRAGLPRATQPCRFLFTSALFVTNQGFFCEHLISKSAIPCRPEGCTNYSIYNKEQFISMLYIKSIQIMPNRGEEVPCVTPLQCTGCIIISTVRCS